MRRAASAAVWSVATHVVPRCMMSRALLNFRLRSEFVSWWLLLGAASAGCFSQTRSKPRDARSKRESPGVRKCPMRIQSNRGYRRDAWVGGVPVRTTVGSAALPRPSSRMRLPTRFNAFAVDSDSREQHIGGRTGNRCQDCGRGPTDPRGSSCQPRLFLQPARRSRVVELPC